MNKENKSRNKRSEKNYAAIDIGSNAVRLLIKHINENSEKKFSKVSLFVWGSMFFLKDVSLKRKKKI